MKFMIIFLLICIILLLYIGLSIISEYVVAESFATSTNTSTMLESTSNYPDIFFDSSNYPIILDIPTPIPIIPSFYTDKSYTDYNTMYSSSPFIPTTGSSSYH